MLALKLRGRYLKDAVVDTGYIALGRAVQLLYKGLLHLYDKDGSAKYGMVQAGYGRRDLTEPIEEIEEDISDYKEARKAELRIVFKR